LVSNFGAVVWLRLLDQELLIIHYGLFNYFCFYGWNACMDAFKIPDELVQFFFFPLSFNDQFCPVFAPGLRLPSPIFQVVLQ